MKRVLFTQMIPGKYYKGMYYKEFRIVKFVKFSSDFENDCFPIQCYDFQHGDQQWFSVPEKIYELSSEEVIAYEL